jgi:hypothetical protein
MKTRDIQRVRSTAKKAAGPTGSLATRASEVVSLAEELGLLSGARTHVVRGRMPAELVERAKQRTGITSDTKLIEVALANIAVEDDYWAWMRKHRGSINPDLDLEF